MTVERFFGDALCDVLCRSPKSQAAELLFKLRLDGASAEMAASAQARAIVRQTPAVARTWAHISRPTKVDIAQDVLSEDDTGKLVQTLRRARAAGDPLVRALAKDILSQVGHSQRS